MLNQDVFNQNNNKNVKDDEPRFIQFDKLPS